MRRSFSGPLLLLAIGAFFLWRNLHPEAPVFDIVAQYWPFLLIAWGLLRLLEGLVWHRDGVRGSFTGGEIVLVVFICIAGSGIALCWDYAVSRRHRRSKWSASRHSGVPVRTSARHRVLWQGRYPQSMPSRQHFGNFDFLAE